MLRTVMRRLLRRPLPSLGAPPAAAATSVAPKRPPRYSLARFRERRVEFERVRARFAAFPSPHLRTNGLFVRRDLLLRMAIAPIRDKLDALAFESGNAGLTSQARARGLRTLVVGRDGAGYPPSAWWRCGAHRSGGQENLLIADNRTREFDTMGPEARGAVLRNSWGPSPEENERVLVLAES